MRELVPVDEFVDWPHVLGQIARVIGRDAALKLAGAVGGIDNVRIPNRPTNSHAWTHHLERHEWEAICRNFGGKTINLPRGAFVKLAKAEIIRLAEQGALNHRQIALRVHVTERYVRRILGRQPEIVDPRQQKLFG